MRTQKYAVLATLLIGATSTMSFAEQTPYYAGQALNVWANTANLRAAPNAEAAVVEKLSFGRAINITTVPTPAVTTPFVFYQDVADPTKPITLNGQWLKVKAEGNEGYIIDQLLLDYAPPHKESTEQYFVRTFGMKLNDSDAKKIKTKSVGKKSISFPKVTREYASPQAHLVFISIDGANNQYRESGTLTLKNYDFNKAMVFMTGIYPIVQVTQYVPNQSLEYNYDKTPETASVTKQGGDVVLKWMLGMPNENSKAAVK